MARATRVFSALVKQTPGAIGYVELIYALQNKMSLRNGSEAMAGEFSAGKRRIRNGRCLKPPPQDSERFPGFDHKRARKRGLSYLLIYMDPPLRESERQGDGKNVHRLHQLDGDGGPKICSRSWLCSSSPK